MMGLYESSMVVARRDFVATVYSRSFILFLLAPILVFGVSFLLAELITDKEKDALQPVIAVVADSATAQAIADARSELADCTSEQSFPLFQTVQPAENIPVQVGRLLADEDAGYSAVVSGTLERPVMTGPSRIDENVGSRIQLVIDQARRSAALDAAGMDIPAITMERVISDQSAGNLQRLRNQLAGIGQGLIFGVTLMLATLLLSNLVEEKSNKVIEVLAAAVPLDSVFLGKLIAMLGISAVGLGLWGGMLTLGFLFVQVLQDWMTLPQVTPAVGWPVFLLMLLIYYCTNFMLLGSLFLGIGGQASNIREIQTLTLPINMLQIAVFLIAMTAVGSDDGVHVWFALIFPFSSPLTMVAMAAESNLIWPHLIALFWQAIWVVLIIRISARLFRKTVLKSTNKTSFFDELRFWRA